MIKASQIISLVEEFSIVKIGRSRRIDVCINPASVSEILMELKEGTRTREFREEPNLRFVLDFKSSDLTAWVAYEAVHADIFPYLTPHIGGKLFTKQRVVDLYGMTPVDDLKEMNIGKSLDRLYLLINNYTIELGSLCLGSVLHNLVLHRDLERIKKIVFLLQRGARSNLKLIINNLDDDGKTPYSLALQTGYQEIADCLKKFGGRE